MAGVNAFRAAAACGIVIAALAVAVSFGTAAPTRIQVSCKHATIGLLAPLTGPAAAIGQEQQHWAQFAVFLNNQTRGATKVSLESFDTQLDDTQAATQADRIVALPQILAVAGPAVSDEATAAGPAFASSHLAFVSGSATSRDLTVGPNALPTFFRTVPTDYAQATTDATFIRKNLKATKVWIVDDGSMYGDPIADRVQRLLTLGGVNVWRDTVPQTTTDYSQVLGKAPSGMQVVFLPWQLGARAAAFYKDFEKLGKTATFFGIDKLDGPEWASAAEGQYLSSVADVKQLPSRYVANVVRGYESKYGDFKTSFGPPTFVAVQVAEAAITAACKDGKATRAEVLAKMQRTYLQTTILGYPIRFRGGDPTKATFYVYRIVGGKPKLIG
jgi:branched-chain amino acid transport system substrate-binding protein